MLTLIQMPIRRYKKVGPVPFVDQKELYVSIVIVSVDIGLEIHYFEGLKKI